jgi:endoplasmic reticulum-Golgi intermediate compartment protein 3
MIEATSSHMPLSHFLTKICAIVGGTFTVIGVVDAFLYRMGKLFTKS